MVRFRFQGLEIRQMAIEIADKLFDIADILGIHPVTAGRCAEKGRKLIANDGEIWDILEKRS